jgi:hypothetical protein
MTIRHVVQIFEPALIVAHCHNVSLNVHREDDEDVAIDLWLRDKERGDTYIATHRSILRRAPVAAQEHWQNSWQTWRPIFFVSSSTLISPSVNGKGPSPFRVHTAE